MRKTTRGRRLRVGIAGTVAALGMAGFGAASAQAVDVTVNFDGGALDIGAIKGADVLDADFNTAGHQGTNTLTIVPDVTIGPPGPSPFTIEPGDWTFPVWTTYNSTVNQTITADFILKENATGTYNTATGALTSNPAEFDAILTTQTGNPGAGNVNDCVITTDLSFSTENSASDPTGAFQGAVFSPSFPIGNGAIKALWADVPSPTSVPPDDCSLVDALIHGPGGLWFGKGLGPAGFVRKAAPPAPPAPPAKPAAKKCKKGQVKKKGKCVKKKKKKKKKKGKK